MSLNLRIKYAFQGGQYFFDISISRQDTECGSIRENTRMDENTTEGDRLLPPEALSSHKMIGYPIPKERI